MKKIKEVSSIVGITRRTLQFYDDEGILTPQRSRENYRLYSKADLEKAWMIVMYRQMDFKLNEVRRKEDYTDVGIYDAFNEKIQSLNSEIDELERRLRIVSRIRKYGIPPVCLDDNYIGEANYVGCIERIIRVLGMSKGEIDTINTGEAESIDGSSYISGNFVNWVERINEDKLALILQLEISKYCKERR